MFMNRMDIDEAVQRLQGVRHYHEAAVFLLRFRDLIDSISDGWPHWSYGRKCSEQLQQLVSDGMWPAKRLETRKADIQLRCAMKRVTAFLKRCGQTKDKPEVRAFLARNAGAWREPLPEEAE